MHAMDRDQAALSNQSGGRVRRWFASMADRLSPTLRCDGCGMVSKRRTYQVTGAVRTIDVNASPWSPWAVCERELICPCCQGSVWEIVGSGRTGWSFM